MADRVCIGQIGQPHGVRGLAVVRAFTEVPEDVAAYGPVETGSGRRLTLAVKGAKKAGLIVAIEGVATRDAAAALAGERLYVDRARLPAAGEEEYYHADLVGLVAEREDGSLLGKVVAVQNFGAGDLLEIDPGTGETVLLPFTAAIVPTVDIAGGRVVVAPPANALAEPAEAS